MSNLKNISFQYFPGVFFVCSLAFVARLIAVFLISPEFWEYETIAKNVLSGQGFVFSHIGNINYLAYCEPLYPGVCILVYFFTHHNVLILELVQAVFSSGIVAIIYLLAVDIYGKRVGLLAGILVAFHPGLILYTVKMHPLIFDTFFISLTGFRIIKLLNKFNLRNIIIASVISGLCVLTRPTILVFLPFGLTYVLYKNRPALRKTMGYLATFLVFFCVIILPWGLRNYFRLGEFILTRTNGPFVFWLGNNPNFTGSAMDRNGHSLFELAPSEFQEKVKGLDELGQNRMFLADAVSYIKKYPADFIERTIKKFYYFWWFNPQAGLLYSKAHFLLYRIVYLLIFVLGLYGILCSFKEINFKNKANISIIIILFLSVSVAQCFFYIETRHRLALEPLLMIFTAVGIYALYKNKAFLTEEK